MAVDLRTYVFLDSLQLQNASFIATVSKGYYPIGGQACCVVEIAPGVYRRNVPAAPCREYMI